MAKKSNVEILNQIRENASMEYQERVPEALGTGGNVSQVFTNYPTMKNEFLTALTNKMVKTLFYSKSFSNPLKALHKGMLPFGYSLEQLFVEMAESKGFWEHWDSGDDTKDLIGTKKPSVKALYIENNFEYKYKVTISDMQLRKAFESQSGLSRLVEQCVSSIYSSAYFDEFKDMKNILTSHADGKYLKYAGARTGKFEPAVLTNTVLPNGQGPSVFVLGTYATQEAKSKALSKAIRTLAGKMAFPSTDYNSAKVKQWSDRKDLIYITTPEEQAELDVEVLAHAFNVSQTDVNVRTIIVDELPSSFAVGNTNSSTYGQLVKADLTTGQLQQKTNVKCRGILLDSDFLQCYDTLVESRTFENGERLATNYFFHKHGIMSTCYFGQIVYLVDELK